MSKPVSYVPSDDPNARHLEAQPEALLIRPQETALIVVDMQNAYASPGGYVDQAGFDIAGSAGVIGRIAGVLDTVDEAIVRMLNAKDRTQKALLNALKDHLGRRK